MAKCYMARCYWANPHVNTPWLLYWPAPNPASTLNSLFSPNWASLSDNIYRKRLTQLSAHGFFTGFCWLMGFEPSQKMSTLLMSTLLRQATIRCCTQLLSLYTLTKLGDLDEVSTFIIYKRLSWGLSAWKEPTQPSSSSTSLYIFINHWFTKICSLQHFPHCI